jgi:hypothetical protein
VWQSTVGCDLGKWEKELKNCFYLSNTVYLRKSFVKQLCNMWKQGCQFCLPAVTHPVAKMVWVSKKRATWVAKPLGATNLHKRDCVMRLITVSEGCRVGCSDFDFFSHFEV